jgi:stage III sporulation protein AH
MDIVNSSNVTNKQKKQALNQLLQLSDCMEKEAAAEQVLSAKGYEDCIVSMTEDSVDVMVALDEITDVDRAKIEDCVQRKTGVSINNIVISSMK